MADIGEALRERRMALKIDVHEVEETTKIRAKYLRALENEEYDLLPSPAYVKSFLRTYADYLGIDSRGLVDVYRREQEQQEDEFSIFNSRIDPAGEGRTRRRRLLLAALALLLIVVVLFVIGTTGGGGPST